VQAATATAGEVRKRRRPLSPVSMDTDVVSHVHQLPSIPAASNRAIKSARILAAYPCELRMAQLAPLM